MFFYFFYQYKLYMTICCCCKNESCQNEYCLSITAQGNALTTSGNVVTATASVLSCSELSYEDAWIKGTELAKQTADIEAQNSANIINQTLDIIKSDVINAIQVI